MTARVKLFSRLMVKPLAGEPVRTALTVFAVALGVAVVLAMDLAGDAATGKFLKDLAEGFDEPATQVVFSADGKTLASASCTGLDVWIWSVADGKPLFIAFNPSTVANGFPVASESTE